MNVADGRRPEPSPAPTAPELPHTSRKVSGSRYKQQQMLCFPSSGFVYISFGPLPEDVNRLARCSRTSSSFPGSILLSYARKTVDFLHVCVHALTCACHAPPPHINHDPCASSCLETLVTGPRVNAPVFTAGGESRVIRLWMWAWPDTAALRTGRGGGVIGWPCHFAPTS